MAIRKTTQKGILTYISGFAEIENNIVAALIPMKLVIRKLIVIPGQNIQRSILVKEIKGITSPTGKYYFEFNIPEGNYQMFVIFDDNRIGKPDAYAYYGATKRIDSFAGDRNGFGRTEIKIIPKPIEKIIMTGMILVEMDFDIDGCEWIIEEKIDDVTTGNFKINNVLASTSPFMERFSDAFKQFTIAKYGFEQKEVLLEIGKKYELIFKEMDGTIADNRLSGQLLIDTRNPNAIVCSNDIIEVKNIKDNNSYGVSAFEASFPDGNFGGAIQIKFIYK